MEEQASRETTWHAGGDGRLAAENHVSRVAMGISSRLATAMARAGSS